MRFRDHSLHSEIIFAFCLGMVFYILWALRQTVLLIYISVLLALIFTPVVQRIQQLHVRSWFPSRGIAIIILLVLGCVIVATVSFFVVPRVVGDIQGFVLNLPTQLQQLDQKLQGLPFGGTVTRHFDLDNLTKYVDNIFQHGFSLLQSLAGGLFEISVLAVLTIYFIIDGPRSFEWAMSMVPSGKRSRLRQVLMRTQERVHRWLGGQLLLMLLLGGSSAVVLGLLHVKYFYALALFAGVANFIPVVGPTATVVLAGAVAATDSWLKLLGVVVFYLAYLQIENAYFSPRIMESAVGLPGVAVIVALVIGGAWAGILGALVAVPSAALFAALTDEYLVNRDESVGMKAEFRRTG